MFRYLRIAFSVTCGMLCLLAIALWARSCSHLDRIDWPVGRYYPGWTATTVSVNGLFLVGVQPEQYNVYAAKAYAFRFNSLRLRKSTIDSLDNGMAGFKIIHSANEWGWQFPLWAAVVAFAIAAGLPWIHLPLRFSLRTLLIAMTVVAVALGLLIANFR